MTDKKELNNEELDKVTGGRLEKDEKQYYESYTRKLDKYETVNYIGQNLYFVYDYERESTSGGSVSSHSFIYGTLNNSYEKSSSCNTTVRTANVTVIISQGNNSQSGTVDISLDKWVAYAK